MDTELCMESLRNNILIVYFGSIAGGSGWLGISRPGAAPGGTPRHQPRGTDRPAVATSFVAFPLVLHHHSASPITLTDPLQPLISPYNHQPPFSSLSTTTTPHLPYNSPPLAFPTTLPITSTTTPPVIYNYYPSLPHYHPSLPPALPPLTPSTGGWEVKHCCSNEGRAWARPPGAGCCSRPASSVEKSRPSSRGHNQTL